MAGGQIAGATAAEDALRDWQAVRAEAGIQYAPVPPVEPPQIPGWLVAFGEWLQTLLEPIGRVLGVSWPILEKGLIALAVLGLLILVWRLLGPVLKGLRRAPGDGEAEWAPDRAAAVALLEDADRLAAEGRFGEAVHLLLQRSVGHIAEARPEWLHPASTAREIAVSPALPERARRAFTDIAVRVERSLFALRDLDASDWSSARAAYADFALERFGAADPAP